MLWVSNFLGQHFSGLTNFWDENSGGSTILGVNFFKGVKKYLKQRCLVGPKFWGWNGVRALCECEDPLWCTRYYI